MLIEKKMQKIIDRIINSIDKEIDIFDITGMIVASSSKEHIGQIESFIKFNISKQDKNMCIHDGKTIMRFKVDKTLTYYFVMEGIGEVIKNYCVLAVSLLEMYLKSVSKKIGKEETMRKALINQLSDLEFQEFVRDYKLETEKKRCVLVIRTLGMNADNVHKLLLKVFPKNQGDFLVLIDSHTVVLVKNIVDEMEEGDILQLAAAIEETVLNETSFKISIGIGTCKSSIYKLSNSYLEACKAIDIGTIYEPANKIYSFDGLLLERFLYEVPIETSKKFYKNIFSQDLKKILNDEMIATIEKFFENSLNLSETARQLYIHRNTLVYRLDKIEKVLGLDLRNFHHAVTFKIMMMLQRQDREWCV